MVPRPPVPGTPMDGLAVRALSMKLLLPAAIRVEGFRTEASATCPTTTCVPSVYSARIVPPVARPTCDNCAEAEPSCELAEEDDGWPNCVMRPAPALVYGFQLRFMSDAPSVNPGMVNAMGLPFAGLVNWPVLSKVIEPLAPEIGNGVPAVPPLISSPGIVT